MPVRKYRRYLIYGEMEGRESEVHSAVCTSKIMCCKKFDSLKYDLKKIEEVVYDISIRGLNKPA